MARYCPQCGFNIPDDARFCSNCGKTLAMHEGIKTESTAAQPKGKDEKNIGLIIAVLIVIIIIPVAIAIAATFYVYTTGMNQYDAINDMTGSPNDVISTPNVALSIDNQGNNATVTITAIAKNYSYWSFVDIQLQDLTDSKNLDEYTDYIIFNSNYGYIENGDQMVIRGISPELQENHQYLLTLSYDITNGLMGSVSWTQ